MQNYAAHLDIVKAIQEGRTVDALAILTGLIQAETAGEAAYLAWVEEQELLHTIGGVEFSNGLRAQYEACAPLADEQIPW